PAQPHRFGALRALLDRVKRRSRFGLHGLRQPAPVPTPDIVPAGGKFIEATYSNSAGTRAYKLYIPSRYQGQALPLIVMRSEERRVGKECRYGWGVDQYQKK